MRDSEAKLRAGEKRRRPEPSRLCERDEAPGARARMGEGGAWRVVGCADTGGAATCTSSGCSAEEDAVVTEEAEYFGPGCELGAGVVVVELKFQLPRKAEILRAMRCAVTSTGHEPASGGPMPMLMPTPPSAPAPFAPVDVWRWVLAPTPTPMPPDEAVAADAGTFSEHSMAYISSTGCSRRRSLHILRERGLLGSVRDASGKLRRRAQMHSSCTAHLNT